MKYDELKYYFPILGALIGGIVIYIIGRIHGRPKLIISKVTSEVEGYLYAISMSITNDGKRNAYVKDLFLRNIDYNSSAQGFQKKFTLNNSPVLIRTNKLVTKNNVSYLYIKSHLNKKIEYDLPVIKAEETKDNLIVTGITAEYPGDYKCLLKIRYTPKFLWKFYRKSQGTSITLKGIIPPGIVFTCIPEENINNNKRSINLETRLINSLKSYINGSNSDLCGYFAINSTSIIPNSEEDAYNLMEEYNADAIVCGSIDKEGDEHVFRLQILFKSYLANDGLIGPFIDTKCFKISEKDYSNTNKWKIELDSESDVLVFFKTLLHSIIYAIAYSKNCDFTCMEQINKLISIEPNNYIWYLRACLIYFQYDIKLAHQYAELSYNYAPNNKIKALSLSNLGATEKSITKKIIYYLKGISTDETILENYKNLIQIWPLIDRDIPAPTKIELLQIVKIFPNGTDEKQLIKSLKQIRLRQVLG